MVLGLLDNLVDLTLEEQVDAVTNWWAQWVSSTGVEHVEDNLDVLVEITSILHTRVSFSMIKSVVQPQQPHGLNIL